MRKKGIAVFCSLAVLFSILFGGFPQKWQVSAAADMTNFAEEAAALTNQFRQENGLPALQMAPVLLDLSAQRAEELSQTYGHNRPDGREWFSVIEDSTLDSNCYAAENVAAGYDTPQEAVQAWIDSPTHRKAMLGEPYQYIGIGVYYLPEDTNHYYMYWDMLLISSQEPLEGARYPDSSTATSETAAATTVTTTQTEPVLPRIVGDVNLDGLVDMSDAVLLQKIIMGQVHVNDAQQQNKDCYADGVLEDTMSRILYVLDYLSHNTDAEKGATLKEIQAYLLNQTNLGAVSVLSIKRDIERLDTMGYTVGVRKGAHNTAYYYMKERGFTFNEIRFLVDSVSINKFLNNSGCSRNLKGCVPKQKCGNWWGGSP